MSQYLCHDFKTPRTDTSRRLPNSFRAVPLLFYLAVVGGAYFMTTDILGYRKAKESKAHAEEVKAQHEAALSKAAGDKRQLDVLTARAESIAKWVEGTRVVQPIGVKVARAIPPEVRLNELYIERNEELPAQLSLSLRMNGGTMAHVQTIERDISALNYRTNGSQQTKQGEMLEYRTNLSWQDL
jgi:hypothetical protein